MTTKSRKSTQVSRRKLLVSGAAAGGGLALGFPLDVLAQKVLGAEGDEIGAWVVIKPNDDVDHPHRPHGDGPGHADGACPAGRRRARVRLEEGQDGDADAGPEPRAQPHLARHGDGRQPRHPRLA